MIFQLIKYKSFMNAIICVREQITKGGGVITALQRYFVITQDANGHSVHMQIQTNVNYAKTIKPSNGEIWNVTS